VQVKPPHWIPYEEEQTHEIEVAYADWRTKKRRDNYRPNPMAMMCVHARPRRTRGMPRVMEITTRPLLCSRAPALLPLPGVSDDGLAHARADGRPHPRATAPEPQASACAPAWWRWRRRHHLRNARPARAIVPMTMPCLAFNERYIDLSSTKKDLMARNVIHTLNDAGQYVINFETMTQTNMKSFFARDILREVEQRHVGRPRGAGLGNSGSSIGSSGSISSGGSDASVKGLYLQTDRCVAARRVVACPCHCGRAELSLGQCRFGAPGTPPHTPGHRPPPHLTPGRAAAARPLLVASIAAPVALCFYAHRVCGATRL